MVAALNMREIATDDEQPDPRETKRERDRLAIQAQREAMRRSGKKSRTYWVWPEDCTNVDRYIERLNQRRAAARTKEGLPT